MAGRPSKHSSCWLHIRHEKDSHGGPVLLDTNHCSRPCGCHASQAEPDPRDNTGRDCPKCRSTLQNQAKRWKLGSAELDDKQVPDSQKFCAPDAGVHENPRMEKMPVLGYTSFLHALGVLIPHTDGLAELTPKNMCLQRGARTRRRCPTR